ncbi:MAG: antitoxin, partial [Acidobacteria bacterium]|nr:antitoxin [Acidobacteriota bacterium]
MKKLGKLAALAGAGAAARKFLRENPDKVNKFADQAGRFVDQRTKGRYHSQIGGVVRKVKD